MLRLRYVQILFQNDKAASGEMVWKLQESAITVSQAEHKDSWPGWVEANIDLHLCNQPSL